MSTRTLLSLCSPEEAARCGGRWSGGTVWLATALVLCTVVCISAQTRSRSANRAGRDLPLLLKQHAEAHDKFAKALEDIARYCSDKNLPAEAERIRRLAEPARTAELRFTPLPREVQPALPADISTEERYWRTQLRHQQVEYARTLFLLSRRALDGRHVTLAYDLVREVALHDPDQATVRKILGYVRNGDEWVSPFEASMLKSRKVWHDQFGWLPQTHVERYEAGDRNYKGRWLSAAKEAEIRRDFSNAWEIKTEHYLVRTNHSLEKGVELAKKLEGFHGLFFQIMAGFFNTQDQARQLFEGLGSRAATTVPILNVVHYYRTREEYVQTLKKETEQPVEITTGMYFPRNGIAYFFYNPEATDDSTLYHEATHQLLTGSRPQTREIAMRANFWIVEGIACYMESFQRDGERYAVGDPGHFRIMAAQNNYMNVGYYVPFRTYTRMGMVAFQRDPNLPKNYSQCAALTHFFMHYDGGKYRDALIEHLSQIYSPRDAVRNAPESLVDLTEVDDVELDRQYGAYIKNIAPNPAPTAPTPAAGQ